MKFVLLKSFTYFSKIGEFLGKNSRKRKKNNTNRSNIHKNLNQDNSL